METGKIEKVDLDDIILSPIRSKHHEDAVMIIHFEFGGQDFDSWGVDSDGKVLSSVPFQTDIWEGTYVNLFELELDEYPLIVLKTGEFTSLKYKVEKVEV